MALGSLLLFQPLLVLFGLQQHGRLLPDGARQSPSLPAAFGAFWTATTRPPPSRWRSAVSFSSSRFWCFLDCNNTAASFPMALGSLLLLQPLLVLFGLQQHGRLLPDGARQSPSLAAAFGAFWTATTRPPPSRWR